MKFIKYNPDEYVKCFARATAARRSRSKSQKARTQAKQSSKNNNGRNIMDPNTRVGVGDFISNLPIPPVQPTPQVTPPPFNPSTPPPFNPPKPATPPPFNPPQQQVVQPTQPQQPYKAPERKTSFWQRFKDKSGLNDFANGIGKYFKANNKNWNNKSNVASLMGQGAKAAARTAGRAALVGGAGVVAAGLTGGTGAALGTALAAKGLAKTANEVGGKSFIDAVKERNLRKEELKRVQNIRKLYQSGAMSRDEYEREIDNLKNREQQIHEAVTPGYKKGGKGVLGGIGNFLSNTIGLGALGFQRRSGANKMKADIQKQNAEYEKRLKDYEKKNFNGPQPYVFQ